MKHFRLFLLALSLSGAASLFAADKPNVLFIAIDDLRPSLGCYGAPDVVTPNIDKLASQGVQFNRAYAQVATCGASRASLFSGLSPTKDRFTNYEARIDEDAPGMPPCRRSSRRTVIPRSVSVRSCMIRRIQPRSPGRKNRISSAFENAWGGASSAGNGGPFSGWEKVQVG
jgi:hypothetical protein